MQNKYRCIACLTQNYYDSVRSNPLVTPLVKHKKHFGEKIRVKARIKSKNSL